MVLYDGPNFSSPIFLSQIFRLNEYQEHPTFLSITPHYLYQFGPSIFLHLLYIMYALMSMVTLLSLLRIFLLFLDVWTTHIVLVPTPYANSSDGVYIVPVFHNPWQKFLIFLKSASQFYNALKPPSLLPQCPTSS